MKKILTALLLILAVMALIACGPDTSDVTYNEMGLSFTIPDTLERMSEEGCDICYGNDDYLFTAKKVTDDDLLNFSLAPGASAEELCIAFMDRTGLTKEGGGYEYSPSNGAHSFYYTYIESDTVSYFCYVVVIVGGGDTWIVEMISDYGVSADTKIVFEGWRSRLMAS